MEPARTEEAADVFGLTAWATLSKHVRMSSSLSTSSFFLGGSALSSSFFVRTSMGSSEGKTILILSA